MLDKIQRNKIVIVAFIFLFLYSSISLVNHFLFKTYALDLGLYTNAVYDYAHLNFNYSQVMQAQPENILSDHFDLFLMMISPLVYFFGTYTLLVVQIVFILLGGLGVYQFANHISQNKKNALIATISFYSFFGIYSALSFDYHSNVIAAMLLPWYILYFFKENWIKSSIVFFVILATKENMSFWMLFISIGLCFHFWSNKDLKTKALIYAVIAATWFVLVIKIVMPAFSNEGTYVHQDYHILGNTFSEVFTTMLSHPINTLKLLFINHTENFKYNWVKAELHIFILLSGGFFLLKKPQFIFMLLPIYFQKLFHDNVSMWGIGGQYSIEFAPILIIGSIVTIESFNNEKSKKILFLLLMILSIAVTLRSFDNTVFFTEKSKQRIYQKDHWTRDFDLNTAYDLLNLIPENASVSAQSPFVPHLCLRMHIYQFPIINDADYVFISLAENSYPLTNAEFYQQIIHLIQSKDWKVKNRTPPYLLLERNNK
jgi:uncharacterized membrane protein